MNDKIKKFLVDIGFTEKEAAVYLALLPVDTASVIELSESTGINRTTLYPILEDLINKKIVIEITEGKKVRFQAEPPERLETFIHNRKTLLEEQEKVLTDIVPQLRGITRKTGEKPIVKIYEGHDGALEAVNDYYEYVDDNQQSYVVFSRDLIEQTFSTKELEGLKKKRIGKNIVSNSIYTKDDGEYITQMEGNSIRIDSSKYPILCDIAVYGDRVRFVTLKRAVAAILIKNKDIAETMESLIRFALDSYKNSQK
jgi:sugar-specific transcriptional regulator TrmB